MDFSVKVLEKRKNTSYEADGYADCSKTLAKFAGTLEGLPNESNIQIPIDSFADRPDLKFTWCVGGTRI